MLIFIFNFLSFHFFPEVWGRGDGFYPTGAQTADFEPAAVGLNGEPPDLGPLHRCYKERKATVSGGRAAAHLVSLRDKRMSY